MPEPSPEEPGMSGEMDQKSGRFAGTPVRRGNRSGHGDRLLDHLQRRWLVSDRGAQRHADGRQPVRIPAGHVTGILRLAHDEPAADAEERRRAFGHHRRGPEAPADDLVEGPSQEGVPSCLLGPASDHVGSIPGAQGHQRLVEEVRPTLVGVQHGDRQVRDVRRRAPGRGRPPPLPRSSTVAPSSSSRRRHGRVPRGTRRRPGRGNPSPGRRRAVREAWWSRRDDHDLAPRILALGP